MTYEEAMKVYPDIPGCTTCEYWRLIGHGALYYKKRNATYKEYASSCEPCCHWGLYNGRPRDTSDMGYDCPHREERKRRKRK